MAGKSIHRVDYSDSDTTDSELNRQSMFNAVSVKRKKGNEEDRCSQVQIFLDEGMDVIALDEDYNTLLHIAVKIGFEKVVKFLLEKGALTDIKNIRGDTAITLTEKVGEHESVRILKYSDESLHEPLPGSWQTQRSDNHGRDSRSFSSNQKCNADREPMKSTEALTIAPASETQSAPCSGFGNNSSQKDQTRNENAEIMSENPRWDTREPYDGLGAKTSLHGFIYQLKHLMLTLHHVWQKGYRFRLATELDSAEKFDDVVIEYEDSKGSRLHRFVQLKHKQGDNKQITADDLLEDEKGDFSLQKYFTSWLKVKKHEDFAESESKCFILCTNIGMDESKQDDIQIEKVQVENSNDFLNVTDTEEQGSCYKLQADKNTKLYNKLKSASELHRLANALAKCVNVDSNLIPLRPDIFKRYYTALAREVLDVDIGKAKRNRKFTDAFIKNDGLSATAQKFREIFLMQVRQFPTHKTSSETNIWTNLKKKSFTTSESSGKSTTGSHQDQLLDDLPNDHIKDEDISDFLDEFILAVDQPNEQKLGESIKRVFGKDSSFNLLNIDFIMDSFQSNILDWLKARQRVYFVREDVQEFFDEMERKISSLITVGLSLHYPSELKKHNVQFKCGVNGLRIFLNTSNSTENLIWQVISFEQTMLTALKIYQTLDQMEEYKKDDSFVFIQLKEFLLPEITRLVLLAFLSSSSQHLLAIDCGLDSTRQDMEKLQENMSEIMTKLHEGKITGKRIILILPEKAARHIRMEQHFKPIYEKEDDIRIDNIEKATQQRLLRKKVIRLQGRDRKTSFFELLGIDNFDDVVEQELEEYRQVMSPKTLVRLIHGEELRIGEESEGLGDISKYYIPRTIDTRVVINDRILVDSEITDRFAISGIVAAALAELLTNEWRRNKTSDRTARNHLANYVILEKSREKEQFDSLCQTKGDLNIHWLQREHDEFIWMRSFGNSTNLLGYRDETRRDGDGFDKRAGGIQLSEDQLAEYDEQRRIVILSDTAGMGKSTVLTRLAEKIRENDPCLLVIKIDLTDYTTVLAAEERKRSFRSYDVEGAVDFLVDKLIYNPKREDVSFFKTIIKVQRKVAILIDGFDEISPDNQETVIDLLQALAKLEVKQLFVTTRPHTSRALEAKLGIFSYTLLPFSKANQIEFLTKFWNTEPSAQNSDSCSIENRDRLQEYTLNVIELLAKSIDLSMKEFTSVPLQTRMVAEVFPFEKSTVPETITIIEMYSKFVEKKYVVYCEEKKRYDLRNPAVKSSRQRERKEFFIMHQRLALNFLFDKTTVAELLLTKGDDSDESWKDMIQDVQRGGIVTRQGEHEYSFIHRTFAEYFAAIFLTEMLRKGGCNGAMQEFFVGQLFVQSEYRVIRAFLNCFLVDKNAPLVREFWKFDMSEHRNPEGHTAYHVAARERHAGIAKFLSNNVRERHGVRFLNINCPSTKEEGETPLIVAVDIRDNLDVVKCLVDAGAVVKHPDSSWKRKTALHVAVQTGSVSVVSYLIENHADIHAQDKDGKTPLHYASQYGNLDMVKHLADSGANINYQDKCGKTPLHYATCSGNLDLVKFLADRGADINSQSKDGSTSLQYAIDDYDQAIVRRPHYAIKRIAPSGQQDIPSTEEDNVNQLNNRVEDLNIAGPANTYFVMSTIAAVPEHAFSEDSSDEEPDEEFDKSFNNNNFPFTTTNPKKTNRRKSKSQMLDKKLSSHNQSTDSKIVDPFLSKVSKTGFEVIEKDKLSTIAISIGLNRMYSLSTRKNNSLILELKSEVSTAGMRYERFCYYWKCAWYSKKDGKEANFEDVRSFYKKLKKRDPDLAKKCIKEEENDGAERNVPYQELREYAKNHKKTKQLIKAFRDKDPNSNIYLHLVDVDVQDFNGVYSAYSRIIHGCCETPTVMSTGYEFPEEPQNKAYHLLGHMERMCRVITTFYIPLGTYYPESNMCILIPKDSDTVEESFIDLNRGQGRILESPILLTNIQKNRQNVSAIFSEDSPIITKIPSARFKKDKHFSSEFNEGSAGSTSNIKQYNQVSQLHSNNLTWSNSLFINHSIKYDTDDETGGKCINDRNGEPLKSVYQQCQKLIRNIHKGEDVYRSRSKLSNLIGYDNAGNIVDAIETLNRYCEDFFQDNARTEQEQRLVDIIKKHDIAFARLSPEFISIIVDSRIIQIIDNHKINIEDLIDLDEEMLEYISKSDEIIDALDQNQVNLVDLIDCLRENSEAFSEALFRGYSPQNLVKSYKEDPLHLRFMTGHPVDIVYTNSDDYDIVKFAIEHQYIDDDDIAWIRGELPDGSGEPAAKQHFYAILMQIQPGVELEEEYSSHEIEECNNEYSDVESIG